MGQEKSFKLAELNAEPVELYKILKFEGLVNSGAEAKLLIDAGGVSVNGVIETRRRRKIVDNDLIELLGVRIKVIVRHAG